MSELIRREDLENWLRTECYGTDTYDDKEYVIGRMRKELPTIAASPWRRVKDELPPAHENVLCCGSRGGMFVGWALGNADVVKATGCGRAFVHGGNSRAFTHWMPLPEPPKEDA